MNLIYHKFFELEVIHSYLPEGISNDFRLMPSSDTQSELQSYNIILRQQHNLFSFYCGSSNADSFDPAAELAALNTLQFQLLNIDFIFKYYTEETDISNNNILYLKTAQIQRSCRWNGLLQVININQTVWLLYF
jgi:hypothetical protein